MLQFGFEFALNYSDLLWVLYRFVSRYKSVANFEFYPQPSEALAVVRPDLADGPHGRLRAFPCTEFRSLAVVAQPVKPESRILACSGFANRL